MDTNQFLPADEISHGFDNVTVGELSPSLVQRYVAAAQRISRMVMQSNAGGIDAKTIRTPPDQTQEEHVDGLPLGTRGGINVQHHFSRPGKYQFTIRLTRDRNEHVEGLSGRHIMEIMIDREVVKAFEVSRKVAKRHSDIDNHLKVRTFVEAGPRRVGVTFRQKSYSLLDYKRQPFEAHFTLHRHPRLSPAIYQVSINGPFESKWANLMMLSFCARLYSFFPDPAGDWGKLKPRGVACVELKLSECGAERRRGACPGRETLSSANPTVMGPGGEGREEKRSQL